MLDKLQLQPSFLVTRDINSLGRRALPSAKSISTDNLRFGCRCEIRFRLHLCGVFFVSVDIFLVELVAMVNHLQVTLLRAKKVNACTPMKSRTMVHATASFKNIVYTTSTVVDMGQNPVFNNDGSDVFHFAYENDDDFITFELFNRNNACIGKCRLTFVKDLEKLEPGKSPQQKTLKVMLSNDKEFGELFLTAQLHHHQVMGEQGNLNVELRGGCFNGITSVVGFKSKTTKVLAKLIYKHTTLTSGILEDMGNKFIWHEDNKFSFLINNNIKPDDVLEVEVYNGANKVGNCKIFMKTLLVNPGLEYKRTGQELLNKKKVGSIDLNTTFIKPNDRRKSYPQAEHTVMYPPPHQQVPPVDHPTTSQHNMMYPPPIGPHYFPRYQRSVSSADAYAPSAPPPPPPEEASGAPPPTKQQKQAYVHHQIQDFFQSFH